MFLIIILGTYLLDQTSKAAVQLWMYQGESLPVIPGVFHLTYIHNPGAAFGLMAYQTPVLVTVSLILMTGVALSYRYIKTGGPLLRYGLSLVVGGALGNLTDRLRYGEVVDFLDFRIWPVFNLADVAIVIGAGLLILELITTKSSEPDKESGL